MSNLRHHYRARSRTDIDDHILPLINIVFLLLAFFLVAGEITARSPVDVTPPVSSGNAVVPPASVTLHIGKDGAIYRGTNRIPPTTLPGVLDGTDTSAAVVLVADAAAEAGRVLALLKTLRDLGYSQTRLVTRSAEE